MSEEFQPPPRPKYVLASITEFGAATANYTEVLDDLRDRQRQRQDKGFDCDHTYAAVLGSTDLIEISRFNHYFHLSAVGGSSAQAFRRSIGVICPHQEQLPPSSGSVTVLGDVLAPQPDRPLLALMYLKQSPLAAMCLPAGSHQTPDFTAPAQPTWSPIQQQLMQHVCCDDTIWETYQDIVTCTLGEAQPDTPILVAPVLGLDSIEIVLVMRAACMEQIAGMAFALRHQTLGRIWPADEDSSFLRKTRQLLSPTHSVRDWNCSPLFSDTTTIVGMPLRQEPAADGSPDSRWTLEPANVGTPAAGHSVILKRSRLFGGSRPSPLPPISETKPSPRRHGALPEPETPAFLMLFDRNDVLEFRTDGEDALNYFPPLRSLDFPELQSHLVQLLKEQDEIEGSRHDMPFRPVRSALSVAVRVVIPSLATHQELPEQKLLISFHRALRECRRRHLSRDASGFWTHHWLEGTRKLGTIYSLTNSGVNLIASVLDYLEDDLEGFIDLLPVIDHLVKRVQGDPFTRWKSDYPSEQAAKALPGPPSKKQLGRLIQSDLLWFYRQAEVLASSRGRRDHPMRLPRDTLSFEGHAGYRTSRDACQAFLESLAGATGSAHHRGQILLLDSSGDGISCDPGRVDSMAVSASAMVLHHPFYWGVFAHELGHGLFRQSRLDCLGQEHPLMKQAQELWGLISPKESHVYGEAIDPAASIETLLAQSATFLGRPRFEKLGKEVFIFTQALGLAAEEVPADILLWQCLFQNIPGDQAEELFWFLVGPTLMFTVQHDSGAVGPSRTVLAGIIIRWFFVSRLMQDTTDASAATPVESWEWAEDLLDNVVVFLRKGYMLDESEEALDSSSLPDDLLRLKCLKQDLGIRDADWVEIAEILLKALEMLLGRDDDDEMASQDEEIRKLDEEEKEDVRMKILPYTNIWLRFASQLRDLYTPSSSHNSQQLYVDYLQNLYTLCQTPRPWLPMVPSHDLDLRHSGRWDQSPAPEIAIARRGGVLAKGEMLHAYNHLTLRFISALHETARQLRYKKISTYVRAHLS